MKRGCRAGPGKCGHNTESLIAARKWGCRIYCRHDLYLLSSYSCNKFPDISYLIQNMNNTVVCYNILCNDLCIIEIDLCQSECPEIQNAEFAHTSPFSFFVTRTLPPWSDLKTCPSFKSVMYVGKGKVWNSRASDRLFTGRVWSGLPAEKATSCGARQVTLVELSSICVRFVRFKDPSKRLSFVASIVFEHVRGRVKNLRTFSYKPKKWI